MSPTQLSIYLRISKMFHFILTFHFLYSLVSYSQAIPDLELWLRGGGAMGSQQWCSGRIASGTGAPPPRWPRKFLLEY
jgi:hypothetical protein